MWAWFAPCFVFPDRPLHCGRHCGESAASSHSHNSCAAWNIPTNNARRLQNSSLLHLCFPHYHCFACFAEIVHDINSLPSDDDCKYRRICRRPGYWLLLIESVVLSSGKQFFIFEDEIYGFINQSCSSDRISEIVYEYKWVIGMLPKQLHDVSSLYQEALWRGTSV